MNALKVLAGLLELPKAERDMIIQLATKGSQDLAHGKPAKANRRRNRNKHYTHKERVWLNEHFKLNANNPDKAITMACEDLGRSFDAIERKWSDYLSGRSDIGTWTDWVEGGK